MRPNAAVETLGLILGTHGHGIRPRTMNSMNHVSRLIEVESIVANRDAKQALEDALRDPMLTYEQRGFILEQLETLEERWTGLRESCVEAAMEFHDSRSLTLSQIEQYAVYSVQSFIDLAKSLVAEFKGVGEPASDVGGSKYGLPEGASWENSLKGPFELSDDYGRGDVTTARASGSRIPQGDDNGIPAWLEDPSQALAMWRSDPHAFMEAYRNLDDDMKQIVLFGLQQATQLNSQITQMLTNLISSEHNTSSSVIRNLKV